MSESPEAMRNRNMAAVRPLSDWAKTNERSGTREIPPHPALSPEGRGFKSPSPPSRGGGQGEGEGEIGHGGGPPPPRPPPGGEGVQESPPPVAGEGAG